LIQHKITATGRSQPQSQTQCHTTNCSILTSGSEN
jgi:hypothetical protein